MDLSKCCVDGCYRDKTHGEFFWEHHRESIGEDASQHPAFYAAWIAVGIGIIGGIWIGVASDDLGAGVGGVIVFSLLAYWLISLISALLGK